MVQPLGAGATQTTQSVYAAAAEHERGKENRPENRHDITVTALNTREATGNKPCKKYKLYCKLVISGKNIIALQVFILAFTLTT